MLSVFYVGVMFLSVVVSLVVRSSSATEWSGKIHLLELLLF